MCFQLDARAVEALIVSRVNCITPLGMNRVVPTICLGNHIAASDAFRATKNDIHLDIVKKSDYSSMPPKAVVGSQIKYRIVKTLCGETQ